MDTRDGMDDVFRVLEEEIRAAGDRDMAVPDIINGMVPALNATAHEGVRHYIQSYHGWLTRAAEVVEAGFGSDEEMVTRLLALRGLLNICLYYTGRLQAAVARDRDVPWETRVAVDLMLTAFSEQLGA